jgi:hypothetical protein
LRDQLLDSNLVRVAVLETGIGAWPTCCATVAFSPDGTLISVVTSEQDFIFDAADGSLVMRLGPKRKTLDYSWTADSSKILITHEIVILLWAVRPDARLSGDVAGTQDPMALALELLTRGFTPSECSLYNIDPCPTLAEMSEG